MSPGTDSPGPAGSHAQPHAADAPTPSTPPTAASAAHDADYAARLAATIDHRNNLHTTLTECKGELAKLDAEREARRRREQRAWADEEPALRLYADTMTQTADVMRAELEQIRKEMHAAMKQTGHVGGLSSAVPTGSSNTEIAHVGRLQDDIRRLIDNLDKLDAQLADCRVRYSMAKSMEEKALWETQLVALQDTVTLTQAEIERLRVSLISKQRAAAYMHHHELGQAKISKLQDDLVSTVSKVDRVKQLLHFPEVEGYRFRSGSAGVFIGSKDLFISELSASFYMSCERIIGADGRPQAMVTIKLGGEPPRMSFNQGSSSSSNSRQQTRFSFAHAMHEKRADKPHAPTTSTEAPARATARTVSAKDLVQPSGPSQSHVATPPDAPQQGLWYNGNPFDKVSADGSIPDANMRGQRVEDRDRTAGPVAEAQSPRDNDAAVWRSDVAAHNNTTPFASSRPDATASGPASHSGLASSIAEGRSRGRRAAVGLLNKIAHSKKFGVGRNEAEVRSPTSAASTSPSAAASARNAIVAKMKGLQRPSATAPDDRPGFRQKLREAASASKKGVGNMGAMMKHASSKAGHAVEHGMSRLRHSSRQDSDFSPTFLEGAGLSTSPTTTPSALTDPPSLAARASDSTLAGPALRPSSPSEFATPLSAAPSSRPSDAAAEQAHADVFEASPESAAVGSTSADEQRQQQRPPSLAAASVAAQRQAAAASETSAGTATSDTTASESLNDFEMERQSARKGVYLVVQASGVKVFGEKGTKVPNMQIKELSLLVEVMVEGYFQWSELDGWRAVKKLKLRVLQFENTISGNSMPVPKTLLKSLLNMLLPAVIERRLLALLPAEVGQYLTLPNTPGVKLGGIINIVGPALGPLNADLTTPKVSAGAKAGKKAEHRAACAEIARTLMGLSETQCSSLSDLLASKHSCILQHRLPILSIAHLCHAVQPFLGHPDLLERWKATLRRAAEALLRFRGEQEVDFSELSTRVLEPAIRKPLRVRFTVTCLDLSVNINGMVQACHDYFVRTAQAEAERSPAGAAALPEQLAALDHLHNWVFSRVQSFQRRFKSARASLLTSIDAQSLQLYLDDVLYHGPLHLEIPLSSGLVSHDDGSLSFALDIPATLANKRSLLKDTLRALFVDAEDADRAYLVRSASTARSNSRQPPFDTKNGQDSESDGAQTQHSHPLLQEGPAVVARRGERISLGTLMVKHLSFKLALEEDLLQRMLDSSISGPITSDSLARVLQCFGPCLQAGVSSTELLQHNDDLSEGHRNPGMQLRSGEICNAIAAVAALGFVSAVPPLRMVRVLHTLLVSLEQKRRFSEAHVAQLDRTFHALARYVSSDLLDVSVSLQVGLACKPDGLVLDVLGQAPLGDTGAGSCCVSFTNDIDMAAVLESIDLSQGAPVNQR